MNLNSHNPVNSCPNRQYPVIFIHGVDDELVPTDHTERLFEKYGGENKDAIYCEGTHNDLRPKETID